MLITWPQLFILCVMYAQQVVGHVLHLENAAERRCNFPRSSSTSIHQRHSTSSDTRPWNSANFPHYSHRHSEVPVKKNGMPRPQAQEARNNLRKHNFTLLNFVFLLFFKSLDTHWIFSFCSLGAPGGLFVCVCVWKYILFALLIGDNLS